MSFTKVEMLKVKQWVDLAPFFVQQYKFNTEITPDREELRRMGKKPNKPSESFREYT